MAAKRAAGCEAIVSPIEGTTMAVVEMGEAAVDGLRDGSAVMSAMEVDGREQ